MELLAPRPGETALDCTLGRGGHAVLLAEAVRAGDPASTGTVVGVDLDRANLEHAQQRVDATGVRFVAVRDSFVRAPLHLRRRELRADVVLADLGVSSTQLDDPERGFSFTRPGPLDMRMDRRQAVTAADLLARLDERELADLIYRYGEDPMARTIARKLVQARDVEPIQTTTQLASLVVDAYGRRARASRMHPATRTFMALRIAVNEELTALQSLLEQVAEAAAGTDRGGWLSAAARVAIISFHSLEDRLVKRAFADLARRGLADLLTRSPVRASEDETRENPRARSAKLRAIRLAGP
jgi:16S rRNA (cytosine1402-N4)-methyltransferase